MADQFRIPPIGPRDVMPRPRIGPAETTEQGASFKKILAETIDEVQRLQAQADQTVKDLVAGEITDVSEALIAVEKADLAFTTMLTLRNRLIQVYEEIMRTQV